MGRLSKCAQCSGTRKPPPQFRYITREVWEADPYCSSECCRAAHGCALPPTVQGGRRATVRKWDTRRRRKEAVA